MVSQKLQTAAAGYGEAALSGVSKIITVWFTTSNWGQFGRLGELGFPVLANVPQ